NRIGPESVAAAACSTGWIDGTASRRATGTAEHPDETSAGNNPDNTQARPQRSHLFRIIFFWG
ncbi:MAG TPA: hypothetical protein DIC23_17355, partial [Planctomycetaceae bacterium]|nr:hypothetical protein [Planctomycetaceae bacterium]